MVCTWISIRFVLTRVDAPRRVLFIKRVPSAFTRGVLGLGAAVVLVPSISRGGRIDDMRVVRKKWPDRDFFLAAFIEWLVFVQDLRSGLFQKLKEHDLLPPSFIFLLGKMTWFAISIGKRARNGSSTKSRKSGKNRMRSFELLVAWRALLASRWSFQTRAGKSIKQS
jgi:hypothetical protein